MTKKDMIIPSAILLMFVGQIVAILHISGMQ